MLRLDLGCSLVHTRIAGVAFRTAGLRGFRDGGRVHGEYRIILTTDPGPRYRRWVRKRRVLLLEKGTRVVGNTLHKRMFELLMRQRRLLGWHG